MKKIILFSVFYVTHLFAQSADYSCRVQHYRLDLELTQGRSTHLWLSNHYGVFIQGYAGVVEKSGLNTHYFFYPTYSGTVELIFKTQDTKDLPKKLTGKINSHIDGFFVRETFNCLKRD